MMIILEHFTSKNTKEFKVTPHYMDVEEYNVDTGYNMGVFLCLGQPIHSYLYQAISIDKFGSFKIYINICLKMVKYLSYWVRIHKLEKAEQMACESAIRKHLINNLFIKDNTYFL